MFTQKQIEAAADMIRREHYAAYGIQMQPGVAMIMAKAALEAAEAAAWEPIETATKDDDIYSPTSCRRHAISPPIRSSSR